MEDEIRTRLAEHIENEVAAYVAYRIDTILSNVSASVIVADNGRKFGEMQRYCYIVDVAADYLIGSNITGSRHRCFFTADREPVDGADCVTLINEHAKDILQDIGKRFVEHCNWWLARTQ